MSKLGFKTGFELTWNVSKYQALTVGQDRVQHADAEGRGRLALRQPGARGPHQRLGRERTDAHELRPPGRAPAQRGPTRRRASPGLRGGGGAGGRG